ncbi:hypothetical protein [Methylobacterium fujisawaense]
MRNERDNLIEEFITTSWDALFRVPQSKLGVTDGGYCSVFTSGHALLERTREAIQSRRPDFSVTSEQAFATVLPEMMDRINLEPDTLKGLAREYLQRLGEVVEVDLADDDALVAAYGRMLEDYVHGETDYNTLQNAPSRPGA